jgi:hypothetical protein
VFLCASTLCNFELTPLSFKQAHYILVFQVDFGAVFFYFFELLSDVIKLLHLVPQFNNFYHMVSRLRLNRRNVGLVATYLLTVFSDEVSYRLKLIVHNLFQSVFDFKELVVLLHSVCDLLTFCFKGPFNPTISFVDVEDYIFVVFRVKGIYYLLVFRELLFNVRH